MEVDKGVVPKSKSRGTSLNEIKAQLHVVPSSNKVASEVNVEANNNMEASKQNAHRRLLEEWYESYMNGTEGGLRYDDELDMKMVETAITNLAPNWTRDEYCLHCESLLDDWEDIIAYMRAPDTSYDRPHVESTIDLEASSRTGCKFCTLLKLCIQGADMMDDYRKIEGRLNKLNRSTRITLSVRSMRKTRSTKYVESSKQAPPDVYIYVNSPGRVSHHLQRGKLIALRRSADPMPFSDRGPGTTNIDSTKGTISTAKQWIKECVETHRRCNSARQYDLPTRLVSVKGGEVRLVLTSGWTGRPRYATLSHCWGGLKFLELLTAELEPFLSAIPLKSLSKTFRDAINITRQLGLDYLWIDSLCIIQDDRSDWEQEASKMAAVYGGSFINIAASAAVNGKGGCFPQKPLYYRGKIVCPYRRSPGSGIYEIYDKDLYTRSVPFSNLAKRAWTFQERLLATRTLHFGPLDLFWECNKQNASESFPEGISRADESAPSVKEPICSDWPNIVYLYSRTNLTYSTDKLVALSGIAQAAQEESGDQYVAGMWRRNIEQHLCWSSSTALKPRPKYRAPSWSWLSLDSGCSYKYGIRRYCTLDARVLEADVTPSGSNPLGSLCDGFLKLACSGILFGYLCTDEVKPENEDASSNVIITLSSGDNLLLDVKKDYGDTSNGEVFVLPICKLSKAPSRVDRRVGTGGNNEVWNSRYFDNVAIQGLLLQPTGILEGQYYRVGYFSLPWSDVEKRDKYIKAVAEGGKATAKSACATILETKGQKYPEQRFIITIV